MSAAASSSTAAAAAEPAPSPIVLLFARGVYALFQSWPVMRAAVLQTWGGPESEAKRTWFVSLVVDEFEERWIKAGSPLYPAVSADQPKQTIAPPDGLDLDDLADLLFDVFLEEFDVELEDGSPEDISRQVIACWSASLQGDEPFVAALEEHAAKLSKKKVDIGTTQAAEDGDSSDDGDDDDSTDGGMDVDAAPAQPRVREEPEVDDDGFTMVKGKGGKKK